MSIKKFLQQEQCDKLVQSISLIIGHHVLITAESGVVLSSSDPTRFGTLHEASVDVIQRGEKVYHDSHAAEKLIGTQPGMTIPIYVEEDVVGTIGITGAPQEISRYAMLIQQMLKIFLDFRNQQQISSRKTLEKQGILRKIITFDNRIYTSSAVYGDAYELGVDLNLPRIAVFISLSQNEKDTVSTRESAFVNNQIMEKLSSIFQNAQDFICPQNNVEYVAFVATKNGIQNNEVVIQKKCHQFERELNQLGYHVRIGIGTEGNSIETLRHSYENACFAVRILENKIRQGNCLAIGDAVLEKLAVSLSEETCSNMESKFFDKVFQSKNSVETLEMIAHWCRSRFNFTQTANAMHIHKSTLVYRFQRVQELHGLDLYDFDRVIAIYLLYIKHKLS